MPTRKIIKIDEEKCTGCGQCIIDCAEGALELIDGKARLIGEIYCDGLGACLGSCPEGALEVIEREAEEFDEAAVEELLASRRPEEAAPSGCPSSKPLVLETSPGTGPACGCPSAGPMTLKPASRPGPGASGGPGRPSNLSHFPVKLQLLGPGAPFLIGADLILLADCVAAAFPDLHSRLLPGRAVAMGCPKLDNVEAHVQRLAEIIRHSSLKSLTVAHMEVPCCHGFVRVAQEALKRSGVSLPLGRLEIGRDGRVLGGQEHLEAA